MASKAGLHQCLKLAGRPFDFVELKEGIHSDAVCRPKTRLPFGSREVNALLLINLAVRAGIRALGVPLDNP
ncbi:MAG: hypothetical protein V2B13_13880 [Pseudomonadota bacterium]